MNDTPTAPLSDGAAAAPARQGTPKIQIRGLTKAFGPKVVLDGIDLDIYPGESMLVIGGSGSGKSVLLKCILGLLHPEAGSIKVDGEEVVGLYGDDLDRVRRKFGMLFQNAALFDSLTVWENVAFGLIQGQRMARGEARGIALEKLAAVGLNEEVARLMPAELSGGMRKRVGLARAIATGATTLVLDEPASALDLRNQDRFLAVIDQLREDADHAILFTTHLPQHAAAVADDALLLFGAEDRMLGPVEDTVTEDAIARLYGIPVRIVDCDMPGAARPARGVIPLFGHAGSPP